VSKWWHLLTGAIGGTLGWLLGHLGALADCAKGISS
jgi:hypothetical protein